MPWREWQTGGEGTGEEEERMEGGGVRKVSGGERRIKLIPHVPHTLVYTICYL